MTTNKTKKVYFLKICHSKIDKCKKEKKVNLLIKLYIYPNETHEKVLE